jgi:Raf kinase inhibitor-like YbhB/YbcL family protein
MVMNNLNISSPAFSAWEEIPMKYSCKGENINPPLQIESLPPGTASIAIILEDPDAPSGVFDHWVLWNIPPVKEIPEDMKSGIPGHNSKNQLGYTGPCPPSGTHRYLFKIYALDSMLDMPVGIRKKSLLESMSEHVLAGGEIVGRFSSSKVKV